MINLSPLTKYPLLQTLAKFKSCCNFVIAQSPSDAIIELVTLIGAVLGLINSTAKIDVLSLKKLADKAQIKMQMLFPWALMNETMHQVRM